MDGVTGDAAYLVARMSALDAAYMGRLIQVARKAGAVGLIHRQLSGIANVGCRRAFGMFAAGTVASLAGPRFPAPPLIGFKRAVRVFLKCLVDVLVTHLAGLRTHVGGWCVSWLCWRRRFVFLTHQQTGAQQSGRRDHQCSKATRLGETGSRRRWESAGKSRRPSPYNFYALTHGC